MAYQRTWTAFNTASSAYHGGDPGWIRHANTDVISRPSYGQPDLADDLGDAATAIAAGVTALATATQVAMAIRQQQQDAKASRQQAADASRRADAEQKTNEEVAKAQIEQTKAQTETIQAAPTKEIAKSNQTLYLIGGGLALGAIILLMRRK